MGADRALLVAGDDAALDAWAVARILKAVVEREKPDLVVLGKQAVDGDSNQVGQILAGLLGWPQATFLASMRLAADGKSATVTREVDAGVEEKRVRAAGGGHRRPAHHRQEGGAQRGAGRRGRRVGGTPRYASLKGIMAAKKKEIKDVTLAELGVDAAPTMKVQRLRGAAAAAGGREGRVGRRAGRQAPRRSEGALMAGVARLLRRRTTRACAPRRCRR